MKVDNRQKLLLIVTGIVLAVLVGDKLIYTPLSNWWDAREKKIAELSDHVKEGHDLIKREDSYHSRWQEMRANALPKDESLAQERLISALNDWAVESGVELNGTTPQWKAGQTDNYRTLECRVDVSGNLWTLTKFIYNVEQGPMGIKVQSADFQSRDNTGRLLNLGLQVSALVLDLQEKRN